MLICIYFFICPESIRTPFFNVAALKYGGHCFNTSTNFDANTICDKALDGLSTSEWVTKTEGIGAWICIGFASVYKINKVKILQRTLSAAQSKDVRIDFSDCSTFAVSSQFIFILFFIVSSGHTIVEFVHLYVHCIYSCILV